jgi:hypothetical protein
LNIQDERLINALAFACIRVSRNFNSQNAMQILYANQAIKCFTPEIISHCRRLAHFNEKISQSQKDVAATLTRLNLSFEEEVSVLD